MENISLSPESEKKQEANLRDWLMTKLNKTSSGNSNLLKLGNFTIRVPESIVKIREQRPSNSFRLDADFVELVDWFIGLFIG